jgi:hypothetical protein
MAIAEFPLAYDWQLAFETTFHNLFPKAQLRFSAAFKEEQDLPAELEKLGLQPKPDSSNYEAWFRTPEGQRWQRIQDLWNRLMGGSIADLVAFVHLTHWPVAEPERLRHALQDLEAMVRLSRESWKRILAETDDNNEWIPSPKQTAVLPGMRVTQERVDGWMQFLDEFEAVLKGTKLIPHWRFDQGINLRRFFLPREFDIVLLLQGSAAVPYLEDGELTTGETWRRIDNLFAGDFFRYFIWFN